MSKPVQIELYQNDGSKKKFTVPFIKARMFRKAIELSEQLKDASENKDASVEDVDAMVDFVVELFSGQFSADDLWDGLSTDQFLPEITRCMNETVGEQKPDPNVRKRSR